MVVLRHNNNQNTKVLKVCKIYGLLEYFPYNEEGTLL